MLFCSISLSMIKMLQYLPFQSVSGSLLIWPARKQYYGDQCTVPLPSISILLLMEPLLGLQWGPITALAPMYSIYLAVFLKFCCNLALSFCSRNLQTFWYGTRGTPSSISVHTAVNAAGTKDAATAAEPELPSPWTMENVNENCTKKWSHDQNFKTSNPI